MNILRKNSVNFIGKVFGDRTNGLNKSSNVLGKPQQFSRNNCIDDNPYYSIDVQRADTDVKIDPGNNSIKARSRINFNYSGNKPTVWFDEGLKIIRITDEWGRNLNFKQEKSGETAIEGLKKGNNIVIFDYEGNLHKEKKDYTSHIEPDSGFLMKDSGWMPSQNIYLDKFKGSIKVTIPKGYEVIANGQLKQTSEDGINKNCVFEITNPLPKGYNVAYGNYIKKSLQSEKGVQINTYLLPEHADKADEYLNGANKILGFFSEKFYPYPHLKFDLVEAPHFSSFAGRGLGDMALFENETFNHPFDKNAQFVSHEISHTWWLNLVGMDKNLFFAESLAEISSILYLKHNNQGELAQKYIEQHLKPHCIDFVKKNGDGSISNSSDVKKISYLAYYKGPLVLNMLKDIVGDEAFIKSLNALAHRFAHKSPSLEDYEKIVNETSGQNLQWFFNQWIYGEGIPHLSISEKEENGKIIYSLVQKETKFKIPVEIKIEYEDNTSEQRKMWIEKENLQLSIPPDKKIKNIAIDPGSKLLIFTPEN